MDAGLSGVKLSLLDAMGMDILSGLMGVVLAVVGATLVEGRDGNSEAPSSAGTERLVSQLASDSSAQ